MAEQIPNDDLAPDPMLRITAMETVNILAITRVRMMEVCIGKHTYSVSSDYFPNHRALAEHINQVKKYYLTRGIVNG